jgi:hypothetical protein
MKKLLSFLQLLLITLTMQAQSISPSQNVEYCPKQNITFTVRVPIRASGTSITVTGVDLIANPDDPQVTQIANAVIDSGGTITKFNFTGRFGDDNIKQTFLVTYTPLGSTTTVPIPFDFKLIKSLKNLSPNPTSATGPCQILNIGQTAATIPKCSIQNIPINFNNIKWSTKDEGANFCWGKITQYEYLIPTGWSIGTTISNGTTWIVDDSNVVVKSDEGNGALGKIRVRASNANCGSNLQNNYDIKDINISRPGPILSINGPTFMCANNNYTYTISGIPSGGIVTWMQNSYYTISPNGNTAVLSVGANANGLTNISASITLPNCSLIFPVTFNVSVGTPNATFNIVSYPYTEPSCYESWGIYTFICQQITGFPKTYTTTKWGYRNLTTGVTFNDATIYGLQYTFVPETAGQYEVFVKAVNQCGVSSIESIKSITVSEFCNGGLRKLENTITLSPNPTKGITRVTLPKSFGLNGTYELINSNNVIVLKGKIIKKEIYFDIDLSNFTVGIYTLILRDNKITKQVKIIKE